MLAAVNTVLPDSAMDFPDGAQRFNWCNCQPSIKHLSGIGNNSLAPSNMMSEADFYSGDASVAAQPIQTPRPVTPLIDFNFWGAHLRGGGGATATPDPIAGFDMSLPGGTPTAVLIGAAAVAAVLFFTLGGKKGKR